MCRFTGSRADAPLYYYSFTDVWIASAYKSLKPAEQARLDPMITGFNPADMYATDHIRRVLKTFPGVFTGIGEFTIHKEFVSAKVAGGEPSLANRALDRIFDFAGESGLLVLVHNDVDVPFANEGATPVYLQQMRDLLLRHPETTVIWAHVGLGRVVHPVQSGAGAAAAVRAGNQVGIVEKILGEPTLRSGPPMSSIGFRTVFCLAPTRWRRATRPRTCGFIGSTDHSGGC